MNNRPEKCPRCNGPIWMVEYPPMDPHHYDGVSEWACKNSFGDEENGVIIEATCDYRIGRFCGKELKKNEIEPRYCKGETHPTFPKTT